MSKPELAGEKASDRPERRQLTPEWKWGFFRRTIPYEGKTSLSCDSAGLVWGRRTLTHNVRLLPEGERLVRRYEVYRSRGIARCALMLDEICLTVLD